MFLYKHCGRVVGVVLGCCLVHVFRDAAGVVGCCRCCSGMSFDAGVAGVFFGDVWYVCCEVLFWDVIEAGVVGVLHLLFWGVV